MARGSIPAQMVTLMREAGTKACDTGEDLLCLPEASSMRETFDMTMPAGRSSQSGRPSYFLQQDL